SSPRPCARWRSATPFTSPCSGRETTNRSSTCSRSGRSSPATCRASPPCRPRYAGVSRQRSWATRPRRAAGLGPSRGLRHGRLPGEFRIVTARPTPAAVPDHERWTWFYRPEGTLVLILLWAGIHTLLRLSLSSTLTADDAREAVLAQSLQWGYQARQPPLYNWLVWGAFRVVGPGLLALTLLKYALLVLGFWLVYLTARRIVDDPRLATLATFALILLLPIGGTGHEALTHSVLVLAACAATVHALVRIADEPSPLAYTGLGVAVGLGLLSKFTYIPFLVALGLAALTVERYRRP